MPAPPKQPTSFLDVLEQVWWRLDTALDAEMIEWSAKLGALEALEAGTTAIIDHHESPNAIPGSLSIIADACNEVGVRINTCYGITDRHGSGGALRGLAENDRYLRECAQRNDPMRRGMVGLHASFTVTDQQLADAAELAEHHGVGVHVHVAEGLDDADAADRLRELSRDDWLLVHGVHLGDDHGLRGTIVHNPSSNMNNSVGYARPARFSNPVALGTDGIGADMLGEFRMAYLAQRHDDIDAGPAEAWGWLEASRELFGGPDGLDGDSVTWAYPEIGAWHVAFTPALRAIAVAVAGEAALRDGVATRVDADEIRAKAAEQARRLHAALADCARSVRRPRHQDGWRTVGTCLNQPAARSWSAARTVASDSRSLAAFSMTATP